MHLISNKNYAGAYHYLKTYISTVYTNLFQTGIPGISPEMPGIILSGNTA